MAPCQRAVDLGEQLAVRAWRLGGEGVHVASQLAEVNAAERVKPPAAHRPLTDALGEGSELWRVAIGDEVDRLAHEPATDETPIAKEAGDGVRIQRRQA